MIRITIDEKLQRQLLATDGVAQLCDSSGMPIARVALILNGYEDPEPLPPQSEYKENATNDITTEELLIRLLKKRHPQRP